MNHKKMKKMGRIEPKPPIRGIKKQRQKSQYKKEAKACRKEKIISHHAESQEHANGGCQSNQSEDSDNLKTTDESDENKRNWP